MVPLFNKIIGFVLVREYEQPFTKNEVYNLRGDLIVDAPFEEKDFRQLVYFANIKNKMIIAR